jgi:hypothetical protein
MDIALLMASKNANYARFLQRRFQNATRAIAGTIFTFNPTLFFVSQEQTCFRQHLPSAQTNCFVIVSVRL